MGASKVKRINADKPHLWKSDVAASVDQFNAWFMEFAPAAFRKTRTDTIGKVKSALEATRDLSAISAEVLTSCPAVLSTLRMSTAPPLAVDRLIGLAGVNKNLVDTMEEGKLPPRMAPADLEKNLKAICHVLDRLLDGDIFPWLESKSPPDEESRSRAASIVADRLCGSMANPIIRNAQERRQLSALGAFLEGRGYVKKPLEPETLIQNMKTGTYAFHVNVPVGDRLRVDVSVDLVVQPKRPARDGVPVLIEAKSAGDFTNTNKRRKEEATKARQLRAEFGEDVRYILFLCGYFGADYLGYEAAEGIDWVWEHRMSDLLKLGL